MTHPRERISFIRVTSEQDESGQLVNTEEIYYSPKAVTVTELRASVDTIAQQQNITQLIEISNLRYNPSIAILNGDLIEWRGYRFTSLAPKVDRYRRFINILAFSEMESTDRNVNQS